MANRTWAEVGQIVRARRESLALSRERAAAKANERMGAQSLSPANITVFEAGGRESYRNITLIALARALDWPDDAIPQIRDGVPPDDLFPQPPPKDDDTLRIAALAGKLTPAQRARVEGFMEALLGDDGGERR